MREIEFRGIKTYDFKWVYGYLANGNHIVKDTYSNGFGHFIVETAEVYPETLGQYIGLKDSKGKKIYEGDIVRVLCSKWLRGLNDDTRILKQHKKDISSIGSIRYSKYKFVVNFKTIEVGLDVVKYGEIEVIDNVHENKEWLKLINAPEVFTVIKGGVI